MNARELRSWLLMQPRPSSLRITAGDQQIHKLDIGPGVKWIEIGATVASLQPELVEAIDEKGLLIRAIRPNEAEDEIEERPNTSLEQDPENARLITFAKLIAEAYRYSTEVAFDKLGLLFDSVVARSNSQEKTISTLDRMVQKLMLEKVAENAAAAGDDGPLTLDSLMAAMIQGKLQGEADRRGVAPALVQAATATANGATKPAEKKETVKK
jgi:hypothetical protein